MARRYAAGHSDGGLRQGYHTKGELGVIPVAVMKRMLAVFAALMMLVAALPVHAEEQTEVAINTDLLALASSAAPLSPDYEPGDLVKMTSRRNNESGKNENHGVYTVSSTSIQLRHEAAEALARLCNDAENAGVILYVRQGYRSYADEVARYARLEKRGEAAQKPGENDYQTGLAVTVVSKDWRAKTLTADFGETKEAKWLAGNAARYGFVLRYPQGKQDVTGWEWEPWHLRYVGREVAEIMQLNNLCLEEFCQGMGFDGAIDMAAPQATVPPVTDMPAQDAEDDAEPADILDEESMEENADGEDAAIQEEDEPADLADESTLVVDAEEIPFQLPVYLPEGVLILEEYGPDGDYEIILFHD